MSNPIAVQELQARLEGEIVTPSDATWDEARQAWNLAVDQRPAAVVYAESADDVVRGDAELAGEPAQTAAERVADDADVWARPGECGQPVLRGRFDDLEPQHSGLHARLLLLHVDIDGAHPRGLEEDRVPERAERRRGVQDLLGPLDREEQPAGVDLRQRVEPELERRHDAEAAAPTAEGPGPVHVAVDGRLGAGRDDAGRPVPARPADPGRPRGPARARLRRRRRDLCRRRGGRRRADPAPARARARAEHVRHNPDARAQPPAHGPRAPGPRRGRRHDARRPADRGYRSANRGCRRRIESSLLSVEIRHLADTVANAKAEHGALASFDAPFILFAVGIAATEEMKATVEAHVEVVQKALEPWDAGRAYLNFAERSTTGQRLFGSETYARLRRVKAQYDPQDVIRSNHPIPPARPARDRSRRTAARRLAA